SKIILSIISIVMALVIVIGAGFGYFIYRVIKQPIQQLIGVMSEVAAGNLSVKGEYHWTNEFGILTNSFNSMVASLKEIVNKMSINAELIAASSEELLAGAEQTTDHA